MSDRNPLKVATRFVAWKGLNRLVHAGAHATLSRLLAHACREVLPDGRTRRLRKKHDDDGRLTVLALSAGNFRGDLPALAATGQIRVLRIPTHWQTRLIYQFLRQGQPMLDYVNPPAGHPNRQIKADLRDFFRGFLPVLYRRLEVDCVIGPHINYIADVDWGAVSDELGVPYLVFHRENMFAAAQTRRLVIDRTRRLGRFEGSHMAVHNEVSRQLHIDAGYVAPERISSLGCIRMDAFMERIRDAGPPRNDRRMVVFYPFVLGRVFEPELADFFRDVHMALVKLAVARSEIDVIMKPKPKFHPVWRGLLDRALDETGIDITGLDNLIIRDDLDVQELSLTADVICGLNTTALLEAAVAGRPVVIPYFGDLRTPKYDERLFFRDAFDLFDIAESADAFMAAILRRLQDPGADALVMRRRRELFERYVNTADGRATERYVALLKTVHDARRPTPAETAA